MDTKKAQKKNKMLQILNFLKIIEKIKRLNNGHAKSISVQNKDNNRMVLYTFLFWGICNI